MTGEQGKRRCRAQYTTLCAVSLVLLTSLGLQSAPRESRLALVALRDEAKRYVAGEIELPDEPDFAFRWKEPVERWYILEAIYKVQDRSDRAADAYVRWQLLSYAPRLDEYKAWQVDRLLNTLPKLSINPVAGEEVVDRFTQLLAALEEHEEAIDVMRREWEKLTADRDRADARNEPARRFAEYWYEHCIDTYGKAGHQEPQLVWAVFVNTLKAGWKVSTEKGRITRALNERREDDMFDRRARRAMCQDIARLRGVEYPAVDEITFYEGKPPHITIGKRRVSKNDADRWIEALQATAAP
ncbi:MAG: hypothetical protein KAS72_10930 [Phycisphaerales bacterium]|nr:hypothetical protein [Phycisphaerales bacterium]